MQPQHVKSDVYEQITAAIVAAIEDGAGKYEMPWHALSNPVNGASRKPYRGINILSLWAAEQKKGYASSEWATYRQWSEVGAQVRKGEHSTIVVFWKFFDSDQEQDELEDEPTERKSARCFARAYHVFNAAQVDGYEARPENQLSESERIAHAEAFFVTLPGTVRFGGSRAYYSPAGDYIQMPPFTQFKSAHTFYSVLSHERAHWAGASSRLNRDLLGRFGDERYAMEELVAELTAAMVCADLRIRTEPRTDHASYIASWLRVLRNDKRAIFAAASKAQEAADFLQQLATQAIPERRAS